MSNPESVPGTQPVPLTGAEILPWQHLFSLPTEDSHEGYVFTAAEFEVLRKCFELETNSSFVAVKTSSSLGNTDINKKKHRVVWPENGKSPFYTLSVARYECHHGPDRNVTHKNQHIKKREESDHQYRKKRVLLQPTKKVDCPAVIVAKEVLVFTQYKGSDLSKWKKEQASKDIRRALENDDSLQMERMILVTLPTHDNHKGHSQGTVEQFSLPIDKRITAKVEEYVSEGFISPSLISSLLEKYVKQDLFPGQTGPAWTNRRFYPSKRDLANQVYQARQKALKSKYDQENLLANMEQWRVENPADNFFFTPATSNDMLDKCGDESTVQSSGFLFLYQSVWQKKLLERYGNEVCLLDATYRTTKYAVPLFFLCGKTNTDYSVVAVFATQFEDTTTIASALAKLREWNPEWNPPHFMVDNCDAEIKAIQLSFPDCNVYLCDFHREQAWVRWLRAAKHGLSASKEEILAIFRRIARAPTEAHYESAVKHLKETPHWIENKELRDWFFNTWLKYAHRWVWCYRQDRLNMKINTNNGVERQNRTFKYEFLTKFTDRTLTGMLTTIMKKYLPEMFRRYQENNLKSSSLYRQYSSVLPDFLHNRPRCFIEHCRQRFMSTEDAAAIVSKSEGDVNFKVLSSSREKVIYDVSLGCASELPSCQCEDWKKTHWPCKHILAIVMHYQGYSWACLPEHYRENPLFTLDTESLQPLGINQEDCTVLSDEKEDQHDQSSTRSACDGSDNFSKQEAALVVSIRDELEMIKAITCTILLVNS